MKRICIDPGHGGHDPGAVGPGGLQEKVVALEVASMLAEDLARDFEVMMTRLDDTFVPLSERARLANDFGADVFISVHCNSGPAGQGEGFEVFTTPGQTASDAMATQAFFEYVKEFPGLKQRVDTADGDPDKEASFAVLRLTKCPAILFELEFIHTVKGEAWLASNSNRQRAAQALARAVRRFFGVPDDGRDSVARSGEGVEMISMPVSDLQGLLERIETAGEWIDAAKLKIAKLLES